MAKYWIHTGPGPLGDSNALTKRLQRDNSLALLRKNKFIIVTEKKKVEIRRKLPVAKHYIVYPETVQGRKDLREFTRR